MSLGAAWLGLDLLFTVLQCVWSCLIKPHSASQQLCDSINLMPDPFLLYQHLASKAKADEHIEGQTLVQCLFGAQ